MSRGWSFTSQNICADREFAVAMAVELLALEESRQNYFSLAVLMEEAYARLRAALQERPDFELVLAEARRDARS